MHTKYPLVFHRAGSNPVFTVEVDLLFLSPRSPRCCALAALRDACLRRLIRRHRLHFQLDVKDNLRKYHFILTSHRPTRTMPTTKPSLFTSQPPVAPDGARVVQCDGCVSSLRAPHGRDVAVAQTGCAACRPQAGIVTGGTLLFHVASFVVMVGSMPTFHHHTHTHTRTYAAGRLSFQKRRCGLITPFYNQAFVSKNQCEGY